MNLSFNSTAQDDVNLIHATHLIQDSTEVASFLKNSGFEIIELAEVSDGWKYPLLPDFFKWWLHLLQKKK